MQEPSPLFSLAVNETTKRLLSVVAYWAKILAVAGSALLAVMVGRTVHAIAVITHTGMRYFSLLLPGLIGSILIAIIPGIGLWHSYRFAGRLQQALETDDQARLHQSISSLTAFLRYFATLLLLAALLVGVNWALQWWNQKR